MAVNLYSLESGNKEIESYLTRDVNQKINDLEIILHATYLYLSENTELTSEIFNEYAERAVKLKKERDSENYSVLKCPSCGQQAQTARDFIVKCIYCGEETFMNPYMVSEMVSVGNQIVKKNELEKEANKKPYDVIEDLKLDS